METNMKTKPILCHERHPLRTRLAFDSAPASIAPRKPAALASAPAKPSASTTPSAKKAAVDGPSREEGLRAILEFLVGHLSDELYPVVEEELKRSVLGSGAGAAFRPAADRRPRVAADSAGMGGFFDRFPSARKIGAV
jgi:hypothetical protein